MQVRDAIRIVFPESVTLVREAREGLRGADDALTLPARNNRANSSAGGTGWALVAASARRG